jgi:LMBR1 domain-containing protein 1
MEKKNKTVMLTLEEQANSVFDQYRYEDEGLKPCAYFWKELVQAKETPHLLIPDTLVVNDKEQPLMWIYTNSQGRVEVNSNISLKDYVSKVTSFCSPNELTATMKRLINKDGNNNFGNDVKLLNSRYLHNLSLQQMGDQLITLQKYVKSHGKRAFLCRTVFSTETHPHCFLITNQTDFYD